MAGQDASILENLENIQSLRDLLQSDMSVVELEKGEIVAKVTIRNTAPESLDGGDVVFVGVGLRITDFSKSSRFGAGSGSNFSRWVKRLEPSRQQELRSKYNEGKWIGGGRTSSFPDATPEEVLFPGESVAYEVMTTRADLPFMDIRVEGSISRLHLFHVSKSLEAMKAWTQPVVAETIRALDAIDFYGPLLAITKMTPALGPQTTLADIGAFKVVVESARIHIGNVTKELNGVFRSAPNQKFRDYMKAGIGQYLRAALETCDKTVEALSGSDVKKMKESAEEMNTQFLKANEVKRGLTELRSLFSVGL